MPLSRLMGLSFVGPSLRVYCGDVATGTIIPPSEDHIEEAWRVFGKDFWAYGLEANRPTWEAIGRFVQFLPDPPGSAAAIAGQRERSNHQTLSGF